MAYIKKADRKIADINKPETDVTAPSTETPVGEQKPEIRVKRKWDDFDMLALPDGIKKKYPGMHFYWCPRLRKELDKFKMFGYTYPVMEKTADEGKGVAIDDTSETSFIIRGDLVLMMIPEAEFQDKREYELGNVKKMVQFIQNKNKNENAAKGIHDTVSMHEELSSDVIN